MRSSWHDMIPLLPLQEFMPWTFVQGKLRASAPCSIFYVDSLHAAWILHISAAYGCILSMSKR
ncbi:hypothetical protein BHE74_00046075 [Ensete ventricosum]|nr:hypothetical protein GW17_00044684 [Ensete ventricosum]RWW47898.1 hypothetical protein BHE74_00046075 [Ensete ventricosum]RZR83462.1 hypothetical protein BHM03_00010064 [Ensete ventricosum]